MADKMSPKPISFKYQGAPKKSIFQDEHVEILDIELGHIEWNEFLTICNKPKERLVTISTLI